MTAEPAGLAARWIRPLLFLGRNRLSIFGAILTTSAALALVGFWIIEASASKPLHPYAGIIFILVLPVLLPPRPRRDPDRDPVRAPPAPAGGHAADRVSEGRPQRSRPPPVRHPGRPPHDAQRDHPDVLGLHGRRLHGVLALLRPHVPQGHVSRVRGLHGLAALARRVHELSYRPGRVLGRQGEDRRRETGRRGRLRDVLAPDSRRPSTPCAPRARPASSATGRRSSRATSSRSSRSTPRTRRTRSRRPFSS